MKRFRELLRVRRPRRGAPRREERADSGTPPSRPRFLPRSRWARWALALLVVFTLVRGGIWAMTQPYFWAPDEDYHFLYVEYLTTQDRLIKPGKPLYPVEYGQLAKATHYDSYSSGPRPTFEGDPKASVRRVGNFPKSAREPTQQGRGVTVVHAPLYYLTGMVVNRALGDASMLTRVAAVRWVSTAIGGLAVFLAWLLAAQVFRREALQLVSAFLVAVQPMIGFLSGIVNNDIAVVAGFTGGLAMLLFLVRTRPRARQGLWVGGAIGLALLVKSTALGLLPLAALAYGAQALTYRNRSREALKSAAIALGAILVIAAWWYVHSVIVYHSLTGSVGDVIPSGNGVPTTLGNIASLASEWTRLTYRTYWWHFYWWEAPRGQALFFVPYFVGALAVLGLAACAFEKRRTLFSRGDPVLRQMALMLAAVFVLYLPPMTADVLRRLNGEGFILVAGRFLLPAYPAVAVLLLIGVRQLIRPKYLPWSCGALVALASFFCWKTWTDVYVHRYFGHAGWQELFRRMSFDRPEFVTPTTYTLAFVVLAASLIGFVVAIVLPAVRRPRSGGADPGSGVLAGRIEHEKIGATS